MFNLVHSKRFTSAVLWMIAVGLSSQFGWSAQMEEWFVGAGTAVVSLLILGWSSQEIATLIFTQTQRLVAITPSQKDDIVFKQVAAVLTEMGIVKVSADGSAEVDIESLKALVRKFL